MFFHKIASRLKRTYSSKTLLIGLIVFLSFICIVVVEPVMTNYRLGGVNPLAPGTYKRYLPPTYENPLGTDYWGRDLLALTLMGIRYSLLIGMITGCLATLIAVTIALAAGWSRGLVDSALNFITNAVLVIPMFPITIAIGTFLRTGLIELCLLLVSFSWPWATRTIRAQILSLREQPYIDLARVTNLRGIEIMFKEIFPNILPYVIASFARSVIGAMIGETGLRLIGIGPSNIPSIGYQLNYALTRHGGVISAGMYNVFVPPILLLTLIFISLNLINVGLDELFNPRLRKVTGE